VALLFIAVVVVSATNHSAASANFGNNRAPVAHFVLAALVKLLKGHFHRDGLDTLNYCHCRDSFSLCWEVLVTIPL